METIGLELQILTDRSRGVERLNHETGEVEVINPDGGAWPAAGLKMLEIPQRACPSAKKISQLITLGFVTLINERVKRYPSGPPSDPWKSGPPNYLFAHADKVVFHTIDGDVTYRVRSNPGKYVIDDVVHKRGKYVDDSQNTILRECTEEDVKNGARTRVDHCYDLELES